MLDLSKVNQGSHFLPDLYVPHITKIDFKRLKKSGIRYGIFDYDGTLVEAGADQLPEENIVFLRDALDNGDLQRVVIATNNTTSDFTLLEKELGAVVIRPENVFDKKPTKSFFNRVLETIGCHPGEAVMVGDKITADIVGGNRVGLKTVLVDPIGRRPWTDYVYGVALRELLHRRKMTALIAEISR
jgi:HAD superfamily phosphatase (TIGR01668 family)